MNNEENIIPITRYVSHHMSIDTVLSDIYDLCSDTAPNIVCSKLHHWSIAIACCHGFVKSESVTGTDLTQAFIKAYEKMKELHSKK